PNSSIADVSWFSIARHVLAQFIERRTREAHSDGLVQGRRFFERTDKVIHLARNQLFDRTVGIVPLARMLCGETQRLSALGQCYRHDVGHRSTKGARTLDVPYAFRVQELLDCVEQ